jgi:membrane associated rhomboid family serine protease
VPVAAVALCAVLLAVYAGELALSWREGPAELDALLYRFGLVPREVLRGRLFTPATALFLHAGPLHLLANLAFLAGLGQAVEPVLGAPRFLALFGLAGGAAAAVHVAAAPGSFVPALGASGAVSGVLGAWWRLRDRPGAAPPRLGRPAALALLGLWLAAQLQAGLSSGAAPAGWAHLGGFAAGLLLAPRLLPSR